MVTTRSAKAKLSDNKPEEVSPKIVEEKRKKKDPMKPKKPLSAYMLFASAKRPQIIKDNPQATFCEVGKIVGEMWKKVDEKDKETFAKKAAVEKKKYDANVAKYKAKK